MSCSENMLKWNRARICGIYNFCQQHTWCRMNFIVLLLIGVVGTDSYLQWSKRNITKSYGKLQRTRFKSKSMCGPVRLPKVFILAGVDNELGLLSDGCFCYVNT